MVDSTAVEAEHEIGRGVHCINEGRHHMEYVKVYFGRWWVTTVDFFEREFSETQDFFLLAHGICHHLYVFLQACSADESGTPKKTVCPFTREYFSIDT